MFLSLSLRLGTFQSFKHMTWEHPESRRMSDVFKPMCSRQGLPGYFAGAFTATSASSEHVFGVAEQSIVLIGQGGGAVTTSEND